MRLEAANFNRVGIGKVTADKLFADNGKVIFELFDNDALYRAPGNIVTVIPLEDIFCCTTIENLEPYGFIKVDENRWVNTKYINETEVII